MKSIFSFLKVALPLAFGAFLIWYVFKDLTPNEKDELSIALHQANYGWVLLSIGLGLLSHVSRAIRWKYTIQPLGKSPRFINSFLTVMVGYVANLALPRLGEVTRPALLAKYENLPFNKLFGTIVAERAADAIILLLIMGGVFFMEFDMLKDMLFGFLEGGSEKFSAEKITLFIILVLVGAGIALFIMFGKAKNPLILKIRTLLHGILEGVKSILKMEKKGAFLFHTVLIWVLYIGMFYLCFFSLEDTSNVPIEGVFASFVMGSLAIVFVQGGLGVFPIAIMKTLVLYGVSKTSALALGWILWSSQTLMIIIIGIASIPLLRLINRKKQHVGSTEHQ